ncbi:hypothetical protein VTJ49DRAFT_6336 [Mycothermus thermophilus]|uniref:Uncharacterized protein n=1 Tax=Humicola insolens TaxID=85995 RepID=A0ABR3V1F2_HUMIN
MTASHKTQSAEVWGPPQLGHNNTKNQKAQRPPAEVQRSAKPPHTVLADLWQDHQLGHQKSQLSKTSPLSPELHPVKPAHDNASATPNMASASSFKVPQVTQADMLAFHDAHFSTLATDHFQAHFLRPSSHPPAHDDVTHPAADDEQDQYYEEEEDDDGLGYYPDGVKRTLTDEQIAIFRHSEIEALRRARESQSQSRNNNNHSNPSHHDEDAAQSGSEDGEVSSPLTTAATAAKKSKKRKRGKQNNRLRPGDEGFIDLRKRTWDVVDKGLATLDYGEEENTGPADDSSRIQRRCISYDD